MPVSIFYISDHAFGHLVHLAQLRGYVPYGSQRVKGLSKFLNDLAKTKFIDTRPDLVVRRHQEEIEHDHAPTWTHTRTRRARNIQLTDDSLARYLLVASNNGIIRNPPYTTGNPQMTTAQPAVSLVLEGIGLEWLTPDTLPDFQVLHGDEK